ncbi:MAG: histidine kinase, partial [Gammaproteobacteria bacterium]|nr:histidine kinase [Gammaproteobacteria bacterium]
MLRRHGLRTQALLTLLAASLIALVPVALLGTQLLADARTHFGEAFATQFTGLNRQNILAPVSRDLALSRRF